MARTRITGVMKLNERIRIKFLRLNIKSKRWDRMKKMFDRIDPIDVRFIPQSVSVSVCLF